MLKQVANRYRFAVVGYTWQVFSDRVVQIQSALLLQQYRGYACKRFGARGDFEQRCGLQFVFGRIVLLTGGVSKNDLSIFGHQHRT